MRINKVLNNNAVVVKDGAQEKIVMGNGIAFQKGKNDIIQKNKVEKIFVLHEGSSKKFQQLLLTLPEKHIEIAERIISHAEGTMDIPLNDHLHIALTDHLSFALERLEQGFAIQNKLTHEIKFLYKKEFEVGLWARDLIKKELDVEIPLDEVAHIALHVHTAKLDSHSMTATLEKATILRDFVEKVEGKLGITIDENSISYQRLITHLRFALNRIDQGVAIDPMEDDILELMKTNYEAAFECSKTVLEELNQEYGIAFPESEISYISLHIQRLMK
jgi:beta-glucoside operon transcriptional antiterminator